MKSFVCLVALVAFVSADVSHLNNMYLPPHESANAQQIEEVNPTASYNAPLPLGISMLMSDAVVKHIQGRFDAGQDSSAAQAEPEVKAEASVKMENLAAEAKPVAKSEESVKEEHPAAEAKPEVDSEESSGEGALAPSMNTDIELPALPEVSNGIETRYGSNGGYVY